MPQMVLGAVWKARCDNARHWRAIRFQRGDGELFKPREMAAAVAALDGSYAGNYQPRDYMELESGVLPESVFEDIADAIRGQNLSDETCRPGEVARAILDLTWDVGLKPRAVLTTHGVLEFNYLDGRQCTSGGFPVDVWEVAAGGYASQTARPWESVKADVKRVVIDSSWKETGILNCAYWFTAFSNCVEVSGFQNLSGMTDARQLFTGCSAQVLDFRGFDPSNLTGVDYCFSACSSLVTIYADSSWALPASGVSGSQCFYNCKALVGGNGTAWASGKSSYTYFRIDAAGTPGYLSV